MTLIFSDEDVAHIFGTYVADAVRFANQLCRMNCRTKLPGLLFAANVGLMSILKQLLLHFRSSKRFLVHFSGQRSSTPDACLLTVVLTNTGSSQIETCLTCGDTALDRRRLIAQRRSVH